MGSRNKIIQGESTLEKFENLEIVLRRMDRRLGGEKISGLIPPIPIFSYVKRTEEDGTFFRFLSPISGSVKGVFVQIDSAPDKKLVTLNINISSMSGKGEFAEIDVQPQKTFAKDLDMLVEKGSRVTMKIKDAINIEGIWLAISFAPDKGMFSKKDFSFEELFGTEV